jgi:hypothetical protein
MYRYQHLLGPWLFANAINLHKMTHFMTLIARGLEWFPFYFVLVSDSLLNFCKHRFFQRPVVQMVPRPNRSIIWVSPVSSSAPG